MAECEVLAQVVLMRIKCTVQWTMVHTIVHTALSIPYGRSAFGMCMLPGCIATGSVGIPSSGRQFVDYHGDSASKGEE
jgi:hypothetical protein